MDIIPWFKWAAALIGFGLAFYFLNMATATLIDIVGISNEYWTAVLFMFANLPLVALIGATLRLFKSSQKKVMY